MISLYDHANVICCKEEQGFSFYAHNVTEGKEKVSIFLKRVPKGKSNGWTSIQWITKIETRHC